MARSTERAKQHKQDAQSLDNVGMRICAMWQRETQAW